MDKIPWKSPRLTFTLPGMEFDFGGIGKEYAADRAAAVCKDLGVEHGLINLAGDISVIGPGPDGQPWPVDINHPRRPEMSIADVSIERGSLATSGDYERFIEVNGKRYCHILDPATGWPASGLSSVSVAAAQCLVAGSISTIAMLKGDKGAEWLKDLNVPHVWMDEEGRQGGTMPSLISL
jgi:thiamine biosynthesis lipoprotein